MSELMLGPAAWNVPEGGWCPAGSGQLWSERAREGVLCHSQPPVVQARGRESGGLEREWSTLRTGHRWEVGKAPLKSRYLTRSTSETQQL